VTCNHGREICEIELINSAVDKFSRWACIDIGLTLYEWQQSKKCPVTAEKQKTHPKLLGMLEVSFAPEKMTVGGKLGLSLKSVACLYLSRSAVIAGFIEIIEAGMLCGRT
jgi:hypothetical protein